MRVLLLLVALACARREAPATGESEADRRAAAMRLQLQERRSETQAVAQCCGALMELWASAGGPFIQTARRCNEQHAKVVAGAATRGQVFAEVSQALAAEKVPPACRGATDAQAPRG